MDQAERNQHRMTIDHLEAEMKDMRKTHDKLAAQIAQQEKARDEIEAQRLNKSPNSYGKDPATLQRNLELLRMRNAALHKVHDRVSDTQSSPKEKAGEVRFTLSGCVPNVERVVIVGGAELLRARTPDATRPYDQHWPDGKTASPASSGQRVTTI